MGTEVDYQEYVEVCEKRAREEGLAEGEACGKAIGVAEGEARGKAEGKAEAERIIAERLAALGMDSETIKNVVK